MPLSVAAPPAPVVPAVLVSAKNRTQQVFPNASLNTSPTNWTEDFDTLNAFDAATGLFVAPSDGYYEVSASLVATSNGAVYGIAILVNGTAKLQPGLLAGGVTFVGGCVHLAKNDVLKLGLTNFSGANVTLFNNAGAPGENYLTIARVG